MSINKTKIFYVLQLCSLIPAELKRILSDHDPILKYDSTSLCLYHLQRSSKMKTVASI